MFFSLKPPHSTVVLPAVKPPLEVSPPPAGGDSVRPRGVVVSFFPFVVSVVAAIAALAGAAAADAAVILDVSIYNFILPHTTSSFSGCGVVVATQEAASVAASFVSAMTFTLTSTTGLFDSPSSHHVTELTLGQGLWELKYFK